MPRVNGNFYRSAGQGYAAEKGKMAESKPAEGGDSSPDKEHETESGAGDVLHVKHHGGGKFSVKHEDGSVTKHESPEDMHQHMDEHFGTGGGSGDESEEYEMGEDDPLKSILG